VTGWLEDNQRALALELGRISALLAAHAEDEPPPGDVERGRPQALESVVESFGLTPFERDILLLCAGCELDARLPGQCAAASGGETRQPTFGLALAALPDAHWSALAPAAPLRRWRLVELEPGGSVPYSALRIDERVLHHLTGIDYLDPRLAGLAEPLVAALEVPLSQQSAAARVAGGCAEGRPVLVCGADRETRLAVAGAGLARLGLRVHVGAGIDLPAHPADRDAAARLWERETVLGRSGLLIELGDGADAELDVRVAAFVEALSAPVIISAAEPLALPHRISVRVDVGRPTPAEQRAVWTAALGERAAGPNGSVDALVSQFDLPAATIRAAAAQVDLETRDLARALWEACRSHARPRLDSLAQRIEPRASWEDLVVPAVQTEILHEIAAHVRQRVRVYEQWCFARKSARGLGISALFEGPSGTGKTMAAEVMAGELALDLYRIDLSQVVSKYIGETEKNLSRVFDAAESGAAILLFDEADALFGRRSEVKDSHDRYANIEVSYLLQRMEAYRGLAILTTNATDAIDPAFMRRIRFVVRFPFPSARDREEIWRRVFPRETPTEGLDPAALSRLNLSGGHIRNIALAAAFLAANGDERVRMAHLGRAAQREALKVGRPLTDGEVAGWT
jgi:MoxR-like ATPase